MELSGSGHRIQNVATEYVNYSLPTFVTVGVRSCRGATVSGVCMCTLCLRFIRGYTLSCALCMWYFVLWVYFILCTTYLMLCASPFNLWVYFNALWVYFDALSILYIAHFVFDALCFTLYFTLYALYGALETATLAVCYIQNTYFLWDGYSHHSPLTTHYHSSLTTHHSPLTTHH